MDKRDDSDSPKLAKVLTLHPFIGRHRRDMLPGSGEEALTQREMRLHEHHRRLLWTNFAVAALGLWLLTGPAVMTYTKPATAWSDGIAGLLLIAFAVCSLDADWLWAPWANCIVGLWLLFAPLIFHTPDSAMYLQGTLVGAFVIAFSVVVPGIPGLMLMLLPGSEVPQGWTFNPSAGVQRVPLILLASLGFFITRYLASFRLGHIHHIWDPFFPRAARALTSSPSPGIAAVLFLMVILLAFTGGTNRWRSMPGLVLLFSVVTVVVSVLSLVIVVSEPMATGAWCTLCLLTALLSLLTIPFVLDEAVAAGQLLHGCLAQGKPFWSTFLFGGTVGKRVMDHRTPRLGELSKEMVDSMFWGMTVPWNLVLSGAVGIIIMCLPALFHTFGARASQCWLIGAAVVGVSITATSEVARAFRFVNVLWALALIFAAILARDATAGLRVAQVLCGLVLIATSLPRGTVRERYGDWDRFITPEDELTSFTFRRSAH